MIAAGDYPFNVDCVRSIDVAKVMRDKFSSKAIGSVLGEMSCEQRLCKRSDNDERKKVSLFAVRDQEKWQKCAPKDWLNEYDSRHAKPGV